MPDFPNAINGNSSLVIPLLNRLTARLPYRSGSPPNVFCREEIVVLTRATLVGISASCISVVIDNLVQVLEELSSFYKEINTHPIHILQSELYILELLAECCSAHWAHACMSEHDEIKIHSTSTQITNLYPTSATSKSIFNHKKSYQNVINLLEQSPKILDDELVKRLIDAVKIFSRPISESSSLPTANILDKALCTSTVQIGPESRSIVINTSNATDASQLLLDTSSAVELYTREILEYASLCNWPRVLEYFKLTFQQAAYLTSGNLPLSSISLSEEKNVLVTMRLITSLWVDSHKLSIIIQEICSIFLRLQKSFQITVATVLPLLITRWLENNPEEFVEIHERHQRLDGGAETLFDMAHTVFDSSRRKNVLYPFSTCILLLQPEIFEVASNLREAKSNSISKKVSFLEGLRKFLRNKNEIAVYCLTYILRVARHFRVNSESALLSYALDVQEEVQEAVFKRYATMNVTLITATFVTLAHLDFSSCEETLVALCLAVNAPQEYKIAFISACMHLIKQKNYEDYLPLFAKASEYIRMQLKLCIVRRNDSIFDEQNKLGKPTENNISIDMIHKIMEFLDIAPLILFVGSPPIGSEWFKYFEETFGLFAPFLVFEDERIRYLAHSISLKLMGDGTRSIWMRSKGFANRMLRYNFWKSSSIVLIAVSEQLESQSDKKDGLTFMYDYLETRLALIKSVTELSRVAEDMPERAIACTKIETALLVSLCSSDLSVCQLVSKCISLFCEEAHLTEEASGSSKGLVPTLHNIDIYKEISARDFRFTGLVAFQKRVRGLLKRIQQPTAGILRAWEISFNSWLIISRQISSQSPETLEEKSLIEWRNYSGLLASLAGACTSDRNSQFEEPPSTGLQWIDIVVSEKNDTLLSRYMEQSIHLLSSSNVRIREAVRESLSTELAMSLYVPLFRKLESVLEVLFDASRTNTSFTAESRILFAEQAASLLNSIVDRLSGLNEMGGALSINVGLLTLKFARFLDEIPIGVGALRVMIKVCQLCVTISQKEELLHLRHDVRIRNQLLEVIFNWVSRPSSPIDSILTTGNRYDEMICLTRDLGRASLKALVSLTYRLPLQPAEGQTDADASDSKSQMFHTYFNRFISLLKYDFAEHKKIDGRLSTMVLEEPTKTPDLAISALSNLLSANIDVGLKHSLSFGYHEDPVIRMAFIKVLCNILMQGTEFSSLSDTSVNEKYFELLELLTNDMSLTIALCDSCPSNEVDEMTICFLNIFESRGQGFTLLEALIEHEVAETENEAELLRRNCVATKILSIYGKWKGALYLKLTLQKVLKRLILTSQDLDLELDPARTVSTEELQKNALQLRVVTKVFIDDICNSTAHIPVSFRKICSIISSAVMKRFPEAKFTAVGAFIFLRFFCPAIVAPDAEGLVDLPPSKEMRRGLLLIAKIVQNLANNVLFGAKEPYMFPLNDFLTQNIYRVTTFLREISVSPSAVETEIETESFDFGSCVALHRFLYDNWDHVRQKVGLLERKGAIAPSTDSGVVEISISEALWRLITNLGPPPMDVSWNRPVISLNSPVSYSRFQHFMLQNSGRNTESLVSTRALYDGGESKDGLPMICIILRNFDAETTDFELLLFGFLKTASRMWHRNFGILIDVTRYNGLNEPQDSLFRKLDLLTPTELSKQLSKIYIYNMNSVFRKCFRKILRFTAKNESSALHPKNVEYHLIGSLQDLQLHFHLSQIHLPKETISVVTDTRYVFQPVMRLSRTRGKIDVVLKVGDQYVQVRTIKKQDIVPGLRLQANINDIFPLFDVDEAPTSIQTEDDSAFGLRTENGKIVMYFTSPRKPDILQAIRGARKKQGKDPNRTISIERLLKPQDVPGTLLNIALMNMAGSDELLRLASYDLLCSLCRAFKFAADSKFQSTKGLCVPRNPSHFVIDISQQLAQLETQLAADFLNEFFVGWESFPSSQRPLSLAYMAPWIPGLRSGLIPSDLDSDKARDKVAFIFRKLIDVALSDHSLSTTLEQCVWPAISRDETCVDIFFEEIIKASHGYGFGDERTEILGSILSSIGTISIRGKLISRLRKALNRTILRPTRQLPENSAWSEICVLLRLCLSTSFDSSVQSQIYLPELFYLITMLANTGSAEVRLTVHRLLINTIHAMCSTFPLEESRLTRLRTLLNSLSETHNSSLFNLSVRDGSSLAAIQDFNISLLLATEKLVKILSEVSTIAAPSIDMSNAWQSRWMSLVASTAFQSNPSIQPRAFVVIGCLARENVDDDFLYQVLVALRSGITRFVEENESEMLVSIVIALTKMIEKLPAESRYGLQLFWLALSLVRLVPLALFNCIAPFLDASLSNLSSIGEFKGGRMVVNLLQGRLPLGDAALQLDDLYGIHFTMENFHFAICASLVKGLAASLTRPTALRILKKFLEITNLSVIEESKAIRDQACMPYLCILISRAISTEEAKEIIWLSGHSKPEEILNHFEISDMINFDLVKDKELLLNASISIVDFDYLEDVVRNRCMIWLNKIAIKRPAVILHL
ncbi:Neurofibromin [Erysiphe necator]|nr:Neurofibromin [Erysiphe necator]